MKPVKINFLVERGDAYLGDDRLEIIIPGDWTTYKLSWAVKETKVITDDKLIWKRNSLAGGSDAELEAVLEGSNTVIKISLLEADTHDLQVFKNYHDLEATDAVDSDKKKTIAKGEFKIDADVQTGFDGSALPSDAVRFQQLDASNSAVGDLTHTIEVNGVKYFEFISPTELAQILKPILDNL